MSHPPPAVSAALSRAGGGGSRPLPPLLPLDGQSASWTRDVTSAAELIAAQQQQPMVASSLPRLQGALAGHRRCAAAVSTACYIASHEACCVHRTRVDAASDGGDTDARACLPDNGVSQNLVVRVSWPSLNRDLYTLGKAAP